MARLSDFQMPVAPMPVDPNVMARNAKAATSLVNWRKTEVAAPRGAPLRGYPRDTSSAEPEAESASDEPDEETEEFAMDSLRNFLRLAMKDISGGKPKTQARHGVSYATDAAFVAQHLNPNQLCRDAFRELQPRAHAMQVNNAARGFWEGLVAFLREQPDGLKIKDVKNKACLSTLVSKTLAA